jgi:adenylate cyclase
MPSAANALVDPLLAEAEIEAERTSAWVRIAIGLILAVGYFRIGGGAYAGEHAGIRYPVIVIGFLGLGATSLIVVATRRYVPSLAYVFSAGDAAMISFNIWESLRVSQLSGNWIAALPAIWAAPLVLSVGALRYRPSVQLWTTVLLTIGYGIVVADLGFEPYALQRDPAVPDLAPLAALERLFSLPPNVMRLVMLTMIGLITALVMARSRRLLLRAVTEATYRTSLSRFLPTEVASIVESGKLAEWRRGRRQRVTVLFVDLRGSTGLAENMDPSSLSVLISSFRRRVTRAALMHGGVIDKFIGDGALLVFGIPEPKSDDPTRAIACAREILRLIDEWNRKRRFDPPVRVGIGVHEGEAYCGVVGDDERLEFTVLGDMVNVAARIEQATKTFQFPLLASAAVVEAAGQAAEWIEVSHEKLRGRMAPVVILVPRDSRKWSLTTGPVDN